MLNLLVETKNEYTTHLTNILTPLIFEGLQSIYKEALTLAKADDILKIFQSFLKRIPKWNQMIIEKESNRILTSTHSLSWLNDLIKATLKANLIVLMYNPTLKTQQKINPSLYQDIKTEDFIHKVYVECARELWNNPYLLYHNFPPIEIKRNQRDCMNIIKDCIKEAIRKLLPVKHILQTYLGEDIEVEKLEDEQIEKTLTDVEERNLTKLIKKDLAKDNFDLEYKDTEPKIDTPQPQIIQPQIIQPQITQPQITQPQITQSQIIQPQEQEQIGGDDKSIGSKILNIINKSVGTTELNSITSQSKTSSKSNINVSETSTNHSGGSDSVKELTKSIKKFDDVLNPKLENVEDKIKKILSKDLATDSDLETSLNYSQEDNDNKYQEIFSNSNISNKQDIKNIKDKKKFFNLYSQF